MMTHEQHAQAEKARQAEHKQLKKDTVDGRSGYTNETRLVFLPPKAEKRVKAWKAKMLKKGYTFGSTEEAQ